MATTQRRRLLTTSAFTPRSIPGCVLWLDASSGTYQERSSPSTPALTNGDVVGTWRSPVGIDLAAPADGQRPTLSVAADAVSVLFDGVNDYVNVDSAIVSGVPVTLAAWFKYPSLSTTLTIIVIGEIGVAGEVIRLLVAHGGSDAIVAQQYDGSVVCDAISTTTATSRNGLWTHVAGVFPSSTTALVYINGTLEATTTSAAVAINTQNYSAVGGLRWGGGDIQFFNGRVDDACIYNRALDGSEIFKLFQEGRKTHL